MRHNAVVRRPKQAGSSTIWYNCCRCRSQEGNSGLTHDNSVAPTDTRRPRGACDHDHDGCHGPFRIQCLAVVASPGLPLVLAAAFAGAEVGFARGQWRHYGLAGLYPVGVVGVITLVAASTGGIDLSHQPEESRDQLRPRRHLNHPGCDHHGGRLLPRLALGLSGTGRRATAQHPHLEQHRVLALALVGGDAQSWNSTGNALEQTCVLHNDALLGLDEMGEVPNGDHLSDAAYTTVNGTMKKRMGAPRHVPTTWRTLGISNGELTFPDRLRALGKKPMRGQEARIISLAYRLTAAIIGNCSPMSRSLRCVKI